MFIDQIEEHIWLTAQSLYRVANCIFRISAPTGIARIQDGDIYHDSPCGRSTHNIKQFRFADEVSIGIKETS